VSELYPDLFPASSFWGMLTSALFISEQWIRWQAD
jgi:hypothetical protein